VVVVVVVVVVVGYLEWASLPRCLVVQKHNRPRRAGQTFVRV
jgi:hypothetical protein